MLTALDHVNIRTADPDAMADWYERVLGLKRGWRPDFGFPGHWLYLGDHPVVHLVHSDDAPGRTPLSLEHFAFRAKGMGAFVARLEELEIPYRRADIAGTDIAQFNIHDPMGNHIHVDFRAREES